MAQRRAAQLVDVRPPTCIRQLLHWRMAATDPPYPALPTTRTVTGGQGRRDWRGGSKHVGDDAVFAIMDVATVATTFGVCRGEAYGARQQTAYTVLALGAAERRRRRGNNIATM